MLSFHSKQIAVCQSSEESFLKEICNVKLIAIFFLLVVGMGTTPTLSQMSLPLPFIQLKLYFSILGTENRWPEKKRLPSAEYFTTTADLVLPNTTACTTTANNNNNSSKRKVFAIFAVFAFFAFILLHFTVIRMML